MNSAKKTNGDQSLSKIRLLCFQAQLKNSSPANAKQVLQINVSSNVSCIHKYAVTNDKPKLHKVNFDSTLGKHENKKPYQYSSSTPY